MKILDRIFTVALGVTLFCVIVYFIQACFLRASLYAYMMNLRIGFVAIVTTVVVKIISKIKNHS